MVKSPSSRLDPERDGPDLFDSHPYKLRMAEACRRPLPPARLAAASGQNDANARKTAAKMAKDGVLEELRKRGTVSGYRLVDRWEDAVQQARLRSLKGRLQKAQVLLLIGRGSTVSFYRLIADRDHLDRRTAWVARLPQHSKFGLLVAIDPELSEDALERMCGELDEVGVGHERVLVGDLAGFHQQREFASRSLPGAFGDET